GRLWKRYLLLNPNYLARLAAQKVGLWKATPPAPATERPASFAV
ncbi:MAG TPA: glycosyltransferase, partial [Rugosimonospora sp.]|nr:glycosyltransferase [Rugosimonospora sp.]